jgi:hypothetical protein
VRSDTAADEPDADAQPAQRPRLWPLFVAVAVLIVLALTAAIAGTSTP